MNTFLLLAALTAVEVAAEPASETVYDRMPVNAEVPPPPRPVLRTFYVSENAPAGTFIGSIEIPSNSGETRQYFLAASEKNNAFAIDEKSGRITVRDSQSLDFEANPVQEIDVEIRTASRKDDELRNSFLAQLKKSGADQATVDKLLTSTYKAKVVVEVADVNEPPRFANQSFSLKTDAVAGSVIGKLSATDPDKDDSLRYTMASDATEQLFTIDANSGAVAVRDPAAVRKLLQGNKTAKYIAEFRVWDSAANFHDAKVPIIIEFSPEPTVANTAVAPRVEQPAPRADAAREHGSADAAANEGIESENSAALPAETAATNSFPFGALFGVATVLGLLGAVAYLFVHPQRKRKAPEEDAFVTQRAAEREASLAALEESFSFKEKEFGQRSQAIESDELRLAEMKLQLDALAGELAARNRELEAERAALLEESARVRTDRDEIESAKRRIAEMESAIERKQAELETREKEAENARADLLDQERNSLSAMRTSLEVGSKSLENERKELEARAREIEAQHAELEAQRAEFLESSARIRSERETVESEKRRIAELEAELNEKRQEWSNRVVEVADVRDESLARQRAELAELKLSLDAQMEQVASKAEELESRKSQLAAERAALESDREELSANAARLHEERAALEVERMRLEELDIDLHQQRNQLSVRSLELADAPSLESIDQERVQLAELKEQIEAQRAELQEASERIQLDREQIDLERARLAELEAELSQQRNELALHTMELSAAQSSALHEPSASVEAAEHLVEIAADDIGVPAGESESDEVIALRHRLADMFGMSGEELARSRAQRGHTDYEGIVKADDRELGSADEIEPPVELTPEPIAVSAVEPESAAEDNSIDSYMRDLLERQRVRQLYGSSAPPIAKHESPRVATSSVVAKTTESTLAALDKQIQESIPEKPVSTEPVHPQDKEAVRNDLASLRSIANQVARSAVRRHTKKKLRNHSLIKISCAAASFLIAGIVMSSSIAATTVLGWAAAGIGGIMLVDLAHWTYVTRKSTSRVKKDED